MRRRSYARSRRNPERHLRLVSGRPRAAAPQRRVVHRGGEFQFTENGVTYRVTVGSDQKITVRQKTNGHRPVVAVGHVSATGMSKLGIGRLFEELAPPGVSVETQAALVQNAIDYRLSLASEHPERSPSASAQQAWETTKHVGDRYSDRVPAGKVALAIRKDLSELVRRRALPAGTKFTSSTQGNSIEIRVTDTPIRTIDPGWAADAVAGRDRHSGTSYRYSPRAQEMLELIDAVAARYNKSESHSQSDYSNVRFYIRSTISDELQDRDFHAATGLHMNDRRIPW